MSDVVALVRVTDRHKPVLANLLQFYLHDFSEFCELELSPHGTYTYNYLDHYFVEVGHEPLFVTAGGQIAGFALMRHHADDRMNQVAEFFVLRAHRRRGVGRAAAHALLRRYPGAWRLEFFDQNAPARRFWPQVVAEVATGPVEVRQLRPPQVDQTCTQLLFRVGPPVPLEGAGTQSESRSGRV